MFRLPSLAEIFGLFTKSRTVAEATKVLSDTAQRLDEVVAHHNAQASDKSSKSLELRTQARDLDAEVSAHANEAAQARIVSSRVTALLS